MEDFLLLTAIEPYSSSKVNQLCRICGASARYKNFGIYTCSSCKVFFKRNAEKSQQSKKCRFDGHCPIDAREHRTCSYCRLQKCFRIGMQPERLRASRTKVIHDETLKRVVLSNEDKSSLSLDQWTLLSTLVQCYDSSKLGLIVQRLIDQEKVGIVDPILVTAIFKEIHQIPSRYLCANVDCYSLSAEDRSSFLRSAIENLTCLGWAIIWARSEVSQCLSFCHDSEQLYDNDSLWTIEKLLRLLDPNAVLMKLVVSLFAFSNSSLLFSPNQSIEVTNPIAILKIENIYAEVTWKYLLHKYGQFEAILRFNKLIQCLLAATVSISKAQDVHRHNNLIDHIVEQTELSLILDDIERL